MHIVTLRYPDKIMRWCGHTNSSPLCDKGRLRPPRSFCESRPAVSAPQKLRQSANRQHDWCAHHHSLDGEYMCRPTEYLRDLQAPVVSNVSDRGKAVHMHVEYSGAGRLPLLCRTGDSIVVLMFVVEISKLDGRCTKCIISDGCLINL